MNLLTHTIISGLKHSGFRRYAKNTSWAFIGRIGSMLVSFAATLFIARSLGPTNFGELSYALSFIALFSFIASAGLDQVLYRELIKHPDKKDILLGSALKIRFITSCVAAILAVITGITFSSNDVSLILIMVLAGTFLFQPLFIISNEFGAHVQSRPVAILSLLVNITLNVLKVIVVYFGNGVIYLALILLLESLLYATGYVYIRSRYFGSILNWKSNIKVIRILIKDSWPFVLSSACVLIYSRIDQVMLKNMIDSTTVGLYDAAVRLSELWYFVPTVVVGSLFPAMVNARIASTQEYKKRIIYLILSLCTFAVMIATATTLASHTIIEIVFGDAFSQSAVILQVYVWALIPITLITIANKMLLTENARVLLFVSAVLGMTINTATNWILIPSLGATGAAIATLLSSCSIVIFVLLAYCYRHVILKT